MTFKKGDVVLLKSGGPEMTVDEVFSSLDTVFCRWFDNNRLRSEEFNPVCLAKKNIEIKSRLNHTPFLIGV